MRAAVFEQIGKPLNVATVADPVRAEGAVILQVAKAGICGSDLHWSITPGALAPGMILGHEFSGAVVDADDRALFGRRATALPMFSCWRCRDCQHGFAFSCNHGRLVGLTEPGAFAEFVAVDARMLQLLPEGVTLDEGALIEPLAVAHQSVVAAGDIRGRDVLVIGAGPIGVAACLFLRHGGARSVVASEPSAIRRARAIEVGATGAIDPLPAPVLAEYQRQIGKRPDVVLVAGGMRGMIKDAIEWVAKRGRVVVAGVCMEEDVLLPLTAISKNVTVAFSGGYEAANFAAVLDAIDKGELIVDPIVTHRITLAELPAAFEALRTPTDQCKLLIGMD